MYLDQWIRCYLLSLAVMSYKPNHRRPLAQTLRQVMTAYFQHYRAGYLVVCSHFINPKSSHLAIVTDRTSTRVRPAR